MSPREGGPDWQQVCGEPVVWTFRATHYRWARVWFDPGGQVWKFAIYLSGRQSKCGQRDDLEATMEAAERVGWGYVKRQSFAKHCRVCRSRTIR